MDSRDYERFRARLTEAGFRESETRYDDSAFGSWLVRLENEPPLRVVWDGKDGWLVVQREIANHGWEDIWIGRTLAEQTPDEVVRALTAI